jgi:uncharacterized protein YdeI (YjbR/CyaY-like superfamily)
MSDAEFSSLSRPIQSMPDFVKDALVKNQLLEAYKNRPPYQQNDYLGWINRAKRPETKEKRLSQMLYELQRGDLYMNMVYKPAKSDK